MVATAGPDPDKKVVTITLKCDHCSQNTFRNPIVVSTIFCPVALVALSLARFIVLTLQMCQAGEGQARDLF